MLTTIGTYSEASVTIGNTAPTISSVVLSPTVLYTEDVLSEVGFGGDEIASLRKRGVI